MAHASKPQLPPKLPPAKSRKPKAEAADHVSIISNDLTILGQDLKIISKGSIQVDGEIQGEIRGIDVTVGAKGKVIGTVAARRVVVDGEVQGEIHAEHVSLRSNSHVEGDVHHKSLAIERGAVFDGRSRRHDEAATLQPKLDVSGDEVAKVAVPGPETNTAH